jgi:hypothetical protein
MWVLWFEYEMSPIGLNAWCPAGGAILEDGGNFWK